MTEHPEGFNWAGFFCFYIYGPVLGDYWPLTVFIPILGYLLLPFWAIYYGVNGWKIAAKSSKYNSKEEMINDSYKYLYLGIALDIFNLVALVFVYVTMS